MAAKPDKTAEKADESDDIEGFSDFVNPSDSCVDFKSIQKVCFFLCFSFLNEFY